MKNNISNRLVKSRNELRAQKVYSGLVYSNLLLPENTPSISYSETVSLSGSGTTPVARLRFRFTRTDGLIDTPMINFTVTTNLSPTYKQFAESNGFTFVANDLSYLTTLKGIGYIAELGDGYVDYYVDFSSDIRGDFFSLNTITISASVQAISNVVGTLSVERLI